MAASLGDPVSHVTRDPTMDLCSPLIWLTLGLLLVAAVGHGIWVVFAALLREIAGGSKKQRGDRKSGRQRCPGCGVVYSVQAEVCPSCGLASDSPTACELRELETAVRQIQNLVRDGQLDSSTGEQVYRGLEARQTRLLEGKAAAPPLPLPRELAAIPEAKPVEEAARVSWLETPEPPEAKKAPIADSAETALPAIVLPEPAPPPAVMPRRTLGQMFAAFMEERNILWGELVGGLLIVGCSIALVISLWQQLEQIPYFPFLIFAVVSGSLFGAGQYTLRHWKLENTSRGLLVISMMLVPLDFLMLARTAAKRDTGLLDWLLEAGGLGALTAMVFSAGRILVSPALTRATWRADWLLTLAVVGSSATQLFVPRWLDAAGPVPWLFALFSLTPVVLVTLAMTPIWLGLTASARVELRQVNALFLFLGMAGFAAAVALGFVLYWTDEPLVTTLQHLAVPIAAAGIPILVSGALVHGKLGPAPVDTASDDSRGLSTATAQLVASGLVLGSIALMLGALILAWPRPLALFVIAGLIALVCFAAAVVSRLPFLHLPSLVGLTISFLTGFHWLSGEFAVNDPDLGPRLLALANSGKSGPALVLLATMLALVSEVCVRTRRPMDGLWQMAGSGTVAFLALVLVIPGGTSAPGRAALVFATCGLGGLIVNLRWRQSGITYAASALLAGGVAYLIHWHDPVLMPARVGLLALLGQASVLVIAYLVVQRLQDSTRSWTVEIYGVPFRNATIGMTALGVLFLLFAVRWSWLTPGCLCACWLAVLWLVVAWKETWPILFAGFQSVLAAAVLLGITSWLAQQDWVRTHHDILHVWSLQAYGLGLGAFVLAWALVRRGLSAEGSGLQVLLNPEWRPVDRVIRDLLIPVFLIVAVAVLWPDVLREVIPFGAQNLFLPRDPWVPLDLAWAWMLLAVLTATLTVALWERRLDDTVLGLLVLGLAGAVLFAHGFRDERAAASALRWSLAAAFLLLSIPVWLRLRLAQWTQRWHIEPPAHGNTGTFSRAILLACAAAPVLLLTALIAALALGGQNVPQPEATSVFAQMGSSPSVLIPVALIALGLVGHGIREQAAGYIFAAGQVFLAVLTGGYALALVTGGFVVDEVEGVFILQLGTIQASFWCLVWLWIGRWRNPVLLGIQTSLALAGNLVLVAISLIPLLFHFAPSLPGFVEQAGTAYGWLGLVAALASGLWYGRWQIGRHVLHIIAGCGVGLGVLAACSAAAWDASGWTSYHVLTLAWTVVALFLLVASWIGSAVSSLGPLLWSAERRAAAASILKETFPPFSTRRWVEGLSAAVVLLALFGAWGDPTRPYWSCAVTLAVSILIGTLAVWTRRPGYVYASGLLATFVGYLVWQAWLVDEMGVRAWVVLGSGLFDRFLLIQIVCLSSASATWSLVEEVLRRREPPIDLRARSIPFAHVAALVALHLLAILVLAAVLSDLLARSSELGGVLTWTGLGILGLALVLCLWDPEAHLWGLPLAPLYELGLVALGLVLHEASLPVPELLSAIALSLASYVLLNVGLVRFFFLWKPMIRRLRLPARSEDLLAGWFLNANGLLAVSVLGLSLWICLEHDTAQARLLGPLATFILLIAGVWLQATDRLMSPDSFRSNAVRIGTLILGLLIAVEASWALLDPACPAPWLHRQVLVLAVLTVGTGLYRSGLAGLFSGATHWGRSARRMGPALAVVAAGLLLLVLVQEFLLYDPDAAVRRTPLALPAMLLVAGLLLGVLVSALWLAVSQRNLLKLTDRGRVRLVWGAEILLFLLLVHLRLNVPDLFPSFLGRNWAFVLMFWSFVGVGLGEWFRRRNLPMLAEPFHRTGMFLPLVPLAAFLARSLTDLRNLDETIPGLSPLLRYLDRLPSAFQLHALLWFLLGGLYTFVAVVRRASAFALLAALAANFGLWVIYANHENLLFLLHPQIWLIPLGLIILAAEHLNRSRLDPVQSQALRYAGLMVIYLSSTADMFITGLAHSVLLPIILALLSIAGVLAGILLRVRAFLYQGVMFLFLVVFAQIWHAAVDRAQTWVWWASGVLLGVLILALFGLFEKRRNDVLRMIEDFKRWQ